jgi:hypothetical protein
MFKKIKDSWEYTKLYTRSKDYWKYYTFIERLGVCAFFVGHLTLDIIFPVLFWREERKDRKEARKRETK